MSWHGDGSHCDRPDECAALADRRQRAREAGLDALSDALAVPSAGGRVGNALDDAIETATRARITPEVIEAFRGRVEAGYRTIPIGQTTSALTAAFHAAGFEVEQ